MPLDSFFGIGVSDSSLPAVSTVPGAIVAPRELRGVYISWGGLIAKQLSVPLNRGENRAGLSMQPPTSLCLRKARLSKERISARNF